MERLGKYAGAWTAVLMLAAGLTASAQSAEPAAPPALAQDPGASPRRNVLFFILDDLRPTLGAYGDTLVRTPNIDALAKVGSTFERAYVQQALCSPSRTSMLTGLRPETTRVADLDTNFRKTVSNAVTLPQLFKQHGYQTRGLHKIYHDGLDDRRSWTKPLWEPDRPANEDGDDERKKERATRKEERSEQRELPSHAANRTADELPDGATAQKAIEVLREMKGQPFFLAVGFRRPHLPFVMPREYWNVYEETPFSGATQPPPHNAPPFAYGSQTGLGRYVQDMKRGKNGSAVSEADGRQLMRGYYASITYVDAQVGRVMRELDRLQLRENTIVVLVGDHGYHLGEQSLWCAKETNYEIAARAPLIVSVPGQKTAGSHPKGLVEFVDLYPTLAELCGLPRPASLEGFSFRPLLDQPDQPWKNAVFTQAPRNIPGQGKGMGRAIRTEQFRLVEWTVSGKKWRETELYDLAADPNETENLAGDPEQATRVRQLTRQLHDGWRDALPAEPKTDPDR